MSSNIINFCQYWRMVVLESFNAARDYLIQIVLAFMCLPIADYLLFHRYGRKIASEVGETSILTQAYPLTIIGLLILASYIFLIVPFRMDSAKLKALDELQRKIDERLQRQSTVDRLAELREYANNGLFNRRVTNDEEFSRLKFDHEQWWTEDV